MGRGGFEAKHLILQSKSPFFPEVTTACCVCAQLQVDPSAGGQELAVPQTVWFICRTARPPHPHLHSPSLADHSGSGPNGLDFLKPFQKRGLSADHFHTHIHTQEMPKQLQKLWRRFNIHLKQCF